MAFAMETGQDLPITGVCVVSDPSRCPPNYTLIDRTYDRPEDADLWKEGFFQRRIMRYLCVERQIPSPAQDVLVDVALINEKDNVPAGFTVLDSTHDSRDKATQKRCICLRWMVPSMTSDAITELIFLTRAQRRAPIGYTLVGEINGLSMCYKMGKIPQGAGGSNGNSSGPGQVIGGMSDAPSQSFSMFPVGSNLPYSMQTATASQAGAAPAVSETDARRPPPISRSFSTAAAANPLSGIEWKLNSKYAAASELQNVTIHEIRGKTLGQLESQYYYDFSVEISVSNPLVLP